jgi:hypothetical protein
LKSPTTNIFIKNKTKPSAAAAAEKKEKKQTAWAASLETAGHRIRQVFYLAGEKRREKRRNVR